MDKWIRWIAGVVIIFFLVFGTMLMTYYTDFLWFKELGYSAVFIKVLITKISLGLIFGAAFFAIFYSNVLLTRRLAPKFRVSYLTGVIQLKGVFLEQYLNRILLAIAAVLSFIAASSASGVWERWLLFLNATPFGTVDPIFGNDISFYVFKLPFWQFLWGFFFAALVVSAIFAMAVHVLDGGIRVVPGEQKFADHVKAHISILAAALSVMLALGFRLLQYGLLYSDRGVAFGASYTDVHAELPVFSIMIVVSLVTAALFLVNIRVKGWKLPLAGLAILVVSLVVFAGVYPAFVQQYRVSPNEIAVENPYIKRNIEFTRKAYGLENVKSRPYSADTPMTAQLLEENKATVQNIRLWDWRPLTKTFNQLQAIRLYYDFADVDIDRYTLDGAYTQTTLAAREMNIDQLPETAKTWVNQHMVYTHGYGIVMNPVNKVTAEGLPDLVVKDIPPSSKVLKIDRPEIYYGEKTNDYVLINTNTNEFDYPKGDKNQYTKYKGTGGVPVGSFFNKLMYAWRFASLKLLVSSTLTADSKVLFNRNITTRTDTLAPFLYYDKDPYIVAAPDGKGKNRLFWIYDAYTVSDMYPYSTPYSDGGRWNYIRNSVKVVIDAYNGTTDFYIVDKKDPVIKTYAKIFPTLFKTKEMPAALKKHWRYPENLFNVQAYMYATYHMLDPQVFYNKEDMWQVAKETFQGGAQQMDPYYMIMRLPGDKREDFMLITPFTPAKKNNMVAWLSANCDSPTYGELVVYKFSKDKLVFGPMQIEARINQDPAISQFLTLVSQRGSTISKGPLLVIPLAGSLLYVQPLYIQAEQGELPELKRVFVSYSDKVVMEASLPDALARLFGAPTGTQVESPAAGAATGAAATASPQVKALIAEALDHYNRAIEAQKAGDWTTYGTELQALRGTLIQLQQAQNQ
ncbi:MAG: UPF0182 family protein [Actinomycetota bacterium]